MDERRKAPRNRMLKAGRITAKDHRGSIDCTIRNMSANGACLNVASPLGIPDIFDLVVDADHSTHTCRVIWRKEKQIGVEFS
jgi:hypothetical protein